MTPARPWLAYILELGILAALGAFGVLLLSTCLGGCGGPPAAARRTIEVATVVVLEADRDFAERYTSKAAEAYEAATTAAEYVQMLAPMDAVARALRTTQSLILAADALINTWEEGAEERWLTMAACIAGALEDLKDALIAAGIPVPAELDSVLTMIGGFGRGLCPQESV